MTRYTTQPAVLPETLPAGTRFKYGSSTWEADEELRLDLRDPDNARYVGLLLHKQSDARDSFGMAARVDWSSVPAPPECVEAPKLHSKFHPYECPATCGPHSLSFRVGKPCRQCGASASQEMRGPFECKICDKVTPRHLEHQVAYPSMVEGGFCPDCYPIAARVAAKDSSGSAGSGAGNHPETAPSGSECWNPAQPDEATRCSECKAPAVRLGMCAYCCDRTQYPDEATRALSDARVTNVAARKRLAAIEQKRPRVTRDSVECAKPHPWECDE